MNCTGLSKIPKSIKLPRSRPDPYIDWFNTLRRPEQTPTIHNMESTSNISALGTADQTSTMNKPIFPEIPPLKESHFALLPDFNARDPLVLTRFISVCDKLFDHFFDNTGRNTFQNDLLFEGILSRIKGDAARRVFAADPKNWVELRNVLLESYGDRRDKFTLTTELARLSQKQGETCFEFHARLETALNNIIAALQKEQSSHELISFVQGLALRVFVTGLEDSVGSLIRARSPATLAECVCILTNEFQFRKQQKSIPPPKNPQSGSVPLRSFPQAQQFRPPFQYSKPNFQYPKPPFQPYKPPGSNPYRPNNYGQSSPRKPFQGPSRNSQYNQPKNPGNTFTLSACDQQEENSNIEPNQTTDTPSYPGYYIYDPHLQAPVYYDADMLQQFREMNVHEPEIESEQEDSSFLENGHDQNQTQT